MIPPPDPKYLAFLASCIAESQKEHTPEELAEAQAILDRSVSVPQFDLLLGRKTETEK